MFIQDNCFEWAVQKLCRVLLVSRSGYYGWVKEGCPQKRGKDVVLLAQIRQVERENHGNYGSRKVHRALREEYGLKVGRHRVQRVMRENNIKSKVISKYKPQITKSDPAAAAFPNLLQQHFETERPNQIWLADITYIRVGVRWAYLAAVLDLHRRKVVGWALGSRPTAELACMALQRALKKQKPGKGLVHHSDRGSQYTSRQYKALLDKHRMNGSMSRTGNPYDNAPMESFFRLLKVEWTNRLVFSSMGQALDSLFYYIDVYYNCKRIHSALGYKTPNNYVKQRLPAV